MASAVGLVVPCVCVCVCLCALGWWMLAMGRARTASSSPPHTPLTLSTISTHYSGVSVSPHNWVASETSHEPWAHVHVYHVPSAPPLHSSPLHSTPLPTWKHPAALELIPHTFRATRTPAPAPASPDHWRWKCKPLQNRSESGFLTRKPRDHYAWTRLGSSYNLETNKNKATPLNLKPKW